MGSEAGAAIELEKKWVLRKQDHARLRNFLRSLPDFSGVLQSNRYLTDAGKILFSHGAVLRIRTERDLECEGIGRVLLNYKPNVFTLPPGAVTIEEHEWDLTDRLSGASRTAAVPTLPDDCLHRVWNSFEERFKQDGIGSTRELRFHEIASMTNIRLMGTATSGLTLGLDSFETTSPSGAKYYELGAEAHGFQEKAIDRFIEEIFDKLRIPRVSDPDYPSKVVLTLLDGGCLEDRGVWIRARHEVQAKLADWPFGGESGLGS